MSAIRAALDRLERIAISYAGPIHKEMMDKVIAARAELARLESAEAEAGRLREASQKAAEYTCASCEGSYPGCLSVFGACQIGKLRALLTQPAKCAQCGGDKDWCGKGELRDGQHLCHWDGGTGLCGFLHDKVTVRDCREYHPCPACQPAQPGKAGE